MKRLSLLPLVLFVFLTLFSVAVPQSPGFVSFLAPQVSAEEETDDYKIIVSAELDGQRVGGITFTITGTSMSKQLNSSATAPTEFSELEGGSYTIAITFPSDSPYELASGSSSREVSVSSTKQVEAVIFQLQNKETPPAGDWEVIQAIQLPNQFTKIGSTTTTFSNLDPENLEAVDSFTFDNPGVNKIVYLQPLDLSTYENYSRILQLGDYLDLETIGLVDFETEFLSPFNKPARITMSKLRLVNIGEDQPALIYRDGRESDEIENITYSNNQLSFEVPGFSTYMVVPRLAFDLSDLEEHDTSTDSNKVYLSSADILDFSSLVDNLDATVNVYNNGQLVNIESKPDNSGEVSGQIPLNPGNNRIRVVATTTNGARTEESFTVDYQAPGAQSENNVSEVFAVLFFLLIIAAGVGVAIYYYRRQKLAATKGKKNKGKSSTKDAVAASKKNSYDPKLLTAEEKILYGVDASDDSKAGDNSKHTQEPDEVTEPGNRELEDESTNDNTEADGGADSD